MATKRKYAKRVKLSITEAPFAERPIPQTPKQPSVLERHGYTSSVEFVASLDGKQFAVLKALLDGYWRGGVRCEDEFKIIAAKAAPAFDSLTA